MTTTPTVFAALAAVMGDVQAVRKADRNEQQRFLFRGIDAVMNAVGPALRKHGVVIVPETVAATHRDTQTTTGKSAREATVLVTYRIYGPAGDSILMQAPGESLDSGDKGTAKAMSVAYRTALLQALTIPTDEPEPDAQTYERAPVQERPAPQQEPPPVITDRQRKRMHALLGELGLDDREKYIKLAAWSAGRDLESTGDLNAAEADRFISYLAERLAGEKAKAAQEASDVAA